MRGDDFKIDATYAKGDTKAVISTSGGSPSFAMFGSTGLRALTRASASVLTTDAVYSGGLGGGATEDLKLTEGLGCPWCVQPQLGSLLVDQPLGQLRCGSV